MSTLRFDMFSWSVILVSEADEELGKVPPQIRKMFDLWVVSVQAFAPWLKGGWRAIFEVRAERKVIVIRIVAHDYKSVGRR